MAGYDLIIALVMMHHFVAKVTFETFELGFTKQEKKREEVCNVNSMKNEGPFYSYRHNGKMTKNSYLERETCLSFPWLARLQKKGSKM